MLGVSILDEASKARFAAKHDLTFPLLADADHAVGDKYGVWQKKSLYGRSFMGLVRTTYLIGGDGKVVEALGQREGERPRRSGARGGERAAPEPALAAWCRLPRKRGTHDTLGSVRRPGLRRRSSCGPAAIGVARAERRPGAGRPGRPQPGARADHHRPRPHLLAAVAVPAQRRRPRRHDDGVSAAQGDRQHLLRRHEEPRGVPDRHAAGQHPDQQHLRAERAGDSAVGRAAGVQVLGHQDPARQPRARRSSGRRRGGQGDRPARR